MSTLALHTRARRSPLFALSELTRASQAVLACAFQLHILGLNARVIAARLGEEALGFATLSSEWVGLGRQLDEQMHHLEQVSEKLVRTIGQHSLTLKRQRLLSACEPDQRVPVLTRDVPPPTDLRQQRQDLRLLVADALRSCTFGIVIARSAKIEAAWSTSARAALANLAVEFEVQLSAILPALRRLAVLEAKELS